MATRQDGGPVFPVIGAAGAPEDYGGMSLRDYFAAKVMQAMVCADADNGRFRDCAARTAEFAYVVADAMLKAREG